MTIVGVPVLNPDQFLAGSYRVGAQLSSSLTSRVTVMELRGLCRYLIRQEYHLNPKSM